MPGANRSPGSGRPPGACDSLGRRGADGRETVVDRRIRSRSGRPIPGGRAFFAKAVAAHSDDIEDWSSLALLLLEREDGPGYRDLCSRAYDRFKDTDSPHEADELVRMHILARGPHFDVVLGPIGACRMGMQGAPE